jgi:DNA invertase Pin-like site-specific DNA recombinase
MHETLPETRPLAFIYDRHATPTAGPLDDRLARCREYAGQRGWAVAGQWVDRGDDALRSHPRPEWDALTAAMQRTRRRPVVCLVESWDRISRSGGCAAALRRLVAQAGGYCATVHGETDNQSFEAVGRCACRRVAGKDSAS